MIPAPCHPDKPHYAKGLCKACYNQARRVAGLEIDCTKKERAKRYNQTEKKREANCRYYLKKKLSP